VSGAQLAPWQREDTTNKKKRGGGVRCRPGLWEGRAKTRALKLGISWLAGRRAMEGAELAAFVETWRGYIEQLERMIMRTSHFNLQSNQKFGTMDTLVEKLCCLWVRVISRQHITVQ
jgi:hypothetical protein